MVDLVNPKTGELYSGLAVIRSARYPRGVDFMTMFVDGLKYLASLDLSGDDSRVLFMLLTRLDFQNWVAVSQETLAEELSMQRQNVGRSIWRLIERHVLEIEKDPADKRRNMYRLNAALGWRGDANQWAKHMRTKAGGNIVPLPGMVLTPTKLIETTEEQDEKR